MPYIAPRTRPTTAPAASSSSERPTSIFTPTFDKSVFEPATKPPVYFPTARTAPTSPTVSPDSTEATSAGPARPLGQEDRISSWTKRKPVPGNIVLPEQTVPTSHPFARSATTVRLAASPGAEILAPPLSPRYGGPVPPRRPGVHSRTVSLNRLESPTSPADSDLADRPGLFWRPPTAASAKDEGDMEILEGEEPKNRGKSQHSGEDKTDTKDQAVRTHASSPKPVTTPQAIVQRSPSHQGVADTEEADEIDESSVIAPEQESDARHALRMRVDKSLPALPLDAGRNSSERPAHVRHQQTSSTSSSPSTRIITPRSTSRAFAPRTPIEEGQQEEKAHRSYWPKRLGTLHRLRKDKDSAKQNQGTEKDRAGSADDETVFARRTSLLPLGEPEEDEAFSVDRVPSKRRLWEAGTLFVRDENGELVCFGDMFPKMPTPAEEGKPIPPIPKTVVFFIRHFWCGQCQDFMFASLSQLDPKALEKAGVKVVIISNGSWKIIKSYRKLFKCPFPIYVDGPRKLYQLMGMTKMTNDFGPLFKGRAAYHQRNVPRQLLHGGKNALTKMPLAYPGKLTQLGGEFVFSPGYNCDFAHRMTNTSNHMEAPDVLRQAGCPHPTKSEVQEITIEETQQAEFERMEKEMQAWRSQRETELERIRRRRAERRGEEYHPMASASLMALGLDGRGEEEAQAEQGAVPLPADSPGSHGSDSSTPGTPDDRDSSLKVSENEDGPRCLPINQLEDVLAWDPDSTIDNPDDRRDMDDKFAAFMREEGLDVAVSDGMPGAMGDTFGRKASVTGEGNGLEVIVEDR